jgi:hypothetical protein
MQIYFLFSSNISQGRIYRGAGAMGLKMVKVVPPPPPENLPGQKKLANKLSTALGRPSVPILGT